MVSQNQNFESQYRQLRAIVQADAELMKMLQSVRECGLASWCIAAGAIRSRVWNTLHGQTIQPSQADVDVCFFEPDAAEQLEQQIRQSLGGRMPGVNWEVVNQAHAHRWNGLPACASLSAALASWPETAAAVGVWLDAAGQLQIIAPLGLEDLFALRVRRNPEFADALAYRRRVSEKNWLQQWPRLTQVDLRKSGGNALGLLRFGDVPATGFLHLVTDCLQAALAARTDGAGGRINRILLQLIALVAQSHALLFERGSGAGIVGGRR